MIAVLVVALQAAACLGLGVSVLALLKLANDLGPFRLVAWSFAIGFGVLGWLIFPLGVIGLLRAEILLMLLAAAALPAIQLRTYLPRIGRATIHGLEWWLLAAIAYLVILSCFEIAAPPSDADSLAYHYALPKLFVEAGRLVFVARAIDGVSPMLVQMTYVPVFALGGEAALQMWVLVSGLGIVALVCAECVAAALPRWFAALVALILMSTPAYIYGAHSGQVEVRTALFVFIGCCAVARARERDAISFAVVGGLAAGFFAGSKYFGLFFCLAAGFVLLAATRRLGVFAAFCVAALVAGSEWYVWNFVHIGDPVFPMLHGLLPVSDPALWTPEAQAAFVQSLFEAERAVPLTVLWWIGYPFYALLSANPVIEGGRTGLGPFLILILPLTLVGIVRFRRSLGHHRLTVPAVIVVLFYTLWFFSGASQRIRHLLPFYPIILLAFAFAAYRGAQWVSAWKGFAFASILTVGLHLAIATIYASNFVWYHLSGESRAAFLGRNVSLFDTVVWLNAELNASDRVVVPYRQLMYYLDVPAFFAHPLNQALVDVRPDAHDPQKFLRQLHAQNITHILTDAPSGDVQKDTTMTRLTHDLIADRCARVLTQIDARIVNSRTLSFATANIAHQTFDIVAIAPTAETDGTCIRH